MNKMKKRERGFTLIELLVVIAIIGILAAAGTIGYQNYITTAGVNTAEKNANDVAAFIQTIRSTGPARLADVDEDGTAAGANDCVAADAACLTAITAKLVRDGYTAAEATASTNIGDVTIALNTTPTPNLIVVCSSAIATTGTGAAAVAGCSAAGVVAGGSTAINIPVW